MRQERNLIITADDFGMTPSINEGIEKAMRDGVVTSTSLLANGSAFQDAVDRARREDLPVGIHLGLVQEPPVSDPASVSSLLGSNGTLPGGYGPFLRRFTTGRIDRKQLCREIRAQFERVIGTGLTVTHVDAHQHLHVLPGIVTMVLELAGEYGVPAVRVPDEMVPSLSSYTISLAGVKILSKWARRRVVRAGLNANGRFRGILQTKAPVDEEMDWFLQALQAGLSEFGIHLGTEPETDQRRIKKDRDFPGTYQWATAVETRERFHRSDINLISWHNWNQQHESGSIDHG